jgi:hypothetical protein
MPSFGHEDVDRSAAEVDPKGAAFAVWAGSDEDQTAG